VAAQPAREAVDPSPEAERRPVAFSRNRLRALLATTMTVAIVVRAASTTKVEAAGKPGWLWIMMDSRCGTVSSGFC
jgi:hypothetical protein